MKIFLALLVLLPACETAAPGAGGAGGSTDTSAASAGHSVTVATVTSASSSSKASSTSSGMCQPDPCPVGACGDYPDGCGGTSACSTICDVGQECNASNECVACATPATCSSCFPSGSIQQMACESSPLPHAGCTIVAAGIGVSCSFYPVRCNWNPSAEGCLVAPDEYCRDVFLNAPCPGSLAPPS